MEPEPPKADPLKTDPPKRKRRWFQFSLRTVMVFTLICAVPCAWLGRRIEQKRRERQALEVILKLGGRVTYDYELADVSPTGPDWLRKLLGEDFFNEIVEGDFRGAGSTDFGLENFKAMTHLYALHLGTSSASDAGLEHLKGLTQLQVLFLDETKVSDAGLEYLQGLTELHFLRLGETNITDAGLVNLEGLKQLQELFLNNTRVSDAGLTSLMKLTRLQILDLTGTNVTDAGVQDLQRALPNCKIEH